MAYTTTISRPALPPDKVLVEPRSIDWVPLDERHGRPRSLFSLWFMSNANVTTLATGMLGAALGAILATSVLAIVLGVRSRHRVHGLPLRTGAAAGTPADDPVACAVRLPRRRLICVIVVFSLVGFNMFNQMLGADVLAHDHRRRRERALVLAHQRRSPHPGDLRLLLDPPDADVADLAVPAHVRRLSPSRPSSWCRFLPTRSRWRTSAGSHSSCSSAAPRRTRSDGRRTCPTTRATCPPRDEAGRALFYTYGGVFVGAVWLMLLGAFVAAAFAERRPLGAVTARQRRAAWLRHLLLLSRSARAHQRHHGQHLRGVDGDSSRSSTRSDRSGRLARCGSSPARSIATAAVHRLVAQHRRVPRRTSAASS